MTLSMRHLPYIGVAILAFIYLASLTGQYMTWVNADHDATNYIISAKYLRLSHPTGAPLFNLMNAGLIRITPGSDYFALAIWSAVFSGLTAGLLFKMTKNLLVPGVFLASATVVSQSTIVEAYAVITFLMVLAYYFHTKDMHRAKYIAIAVGLAIHHLPILLIPPFFAWDYLNGKDRRNVLFVLLALPWYLYIPIFNREPYIWIKGNYLKAYIDYFGAQGGLLGGLAIWPPENLIMRMKDITVITLAGFGAAIPFIFLGMRERFRNKDWLLPIIFVIPAAYYFTMLTSNAYIYMLPVFAYGSLLLTGGKIYSRIIIAVGIVTLLIINAQAYDIGNNLDPEYVAQAYYDRLEELPGDAVIYTYLNGWERGAIWLHNEDFGTNQRSVSKLWISETDRDQRIRDIEYGLENGVLYHSVDVDQTIKHSIIELWNPTLEEVHELLYAE